MPENLQSATSSAHDRDRRASPAADPEGLLAALAQAMHLHAVMPDRGVLLPASLSTLGEALGATRLVLVVELRDARSRASHYQILHEWVRPGRASWLARGLGTLPADRAVLFASVCRTGIGFQGGLDDVPSPQREMLQLLGTASLACAPFSAGEPMSGLLCVEDERAGRAWTRAELDTLAIAARNLGALRLRQGVDERLMAERERAVQLARANQTLQRSLERVAEDVRVESLITAFLVEVVQLLEARGGSVVLADAGAGAAFRPAAVYQGGRLLEGAEIAAHPFFGRFAECTARDPLGLRSAMALGDAPSIAVEALRVAIPEAYAYHRSQGHRQLLHLPLRFGGRLLGVTCLAKAQERMPGDVQRDVAAALAQQFSLALELTRKAELAQHAAVSREQERSEQSRAAELARANRILRDTAASVAAATDLRSIATIFMREALRASDASAAALFLERSGGFEMVMVAEDGVFQDGMTLENNPCTAEIYAASRDPANRRYARLRAGQADWRFMASPDDDWEEGELQYHREAGHQAVWDVPFAADGKVIGFLCLCFRGMATPVAIVTETVGALANQISVGLEMTAIAARLRDSEVREAVSNERSRMARDIHDSLAQSFSSIAMQTEALLAGVGEGDRVRRTLERIADTARLGIGEARATALALRPLENRIAALDEALEGLARRCTVQGGMACDFRTDGKPRLLGLEVQEALLRIAQEAISNALRHSGGTRVDVTVSYAEDCIALSIRDDGSGLCINFAQASGMGMRGMRQRTQELGGRFEAVRGQPKGTRIEVVLPLRSEEDA
ncbi:MAG: sensor histidine kinase [Pseudomonadota bacterium]|nr:sensor histidine kinase [Pseudomonadota bacterium]